MNASWQKIGRWLIVAVFAGSLWILYRNLSQYNLQDVSERILEIPRWRLFAAVGLTIVNYVVLIGYDALALRAIRRRLSWPKLAFGSFTGFVSSYNLGPLLGGSTVRFRLYSSWGFSPAEILQILGMLGITFSVGILFLAGGVFVCLPSDMLQFLPISTGHVRGLGWLLLAMTAGFVGFAAWWRKPLRLMGTVIQLPPVSITLAQILVATVDFLITAGCLHVLIGEQISLSYWQTLAILLLAMVTAVASHVPGGVGVFEVVVLELAGTQNTPELLACLLAFRVIYFLLPLACAMGMLAANELASQGSTIGHLSPAVARWSSAVVPRFLAAGTFLAGVVLLFSGVTPIRNSRLLWVEDWIPLTVVELSHFLGSVIGASLLIIALGLNRRLDSAWYLSILLAIAGIVVSILKGFDFEEAFVMAAVAVVLVLYRKSFYRRGQLVNQALSRDSLCAIALVVICAIWLAMFANKHVHYSSQMWWDFSFQGDASRVLRGGVGAICVLLLFAVRRLLVPHAPRHETPTVADSQLMERVVQNSPVAASSLALLGDKRIFWNEDKSAFLMYGVQGTSWIAMREPVGPREAVAELVWAFRTFVDEHAGRPVFYQVGEESLPIYLDQGLTLLKLGEEARVALADFSMDGPSRRNLRRTHSRLQRLGCSFEVLAGEDLVRILPELKEISTAWLTSKGMQEKGFSLGYFDEAYLSHFPCGIVRQEGRIMAFTNLWCSGDQEEVTADLMRYRPDSPSHIMEYLLIESIHWAQSQGYRWFSLGMAPLSGISDRPLAPLWNRAAGLIFRHGDHLYNFEGLREFKERFTPIWFPKYLAAPGGWDWRRS